MPPQDIPAVDTGAAAAPVRPFSKVPYDPARALEERRGRIAMVLLYLLIGVVLATFVTMWFNMTSSGEEAQMQKRTQDLKEVLQVILPTITTLLGAVIGFYYGEKSKGRGEG